MHNLDRRLTVEVSIDTVWLSTEDPGVDHTFVLSMADESRPSGQGDLAPVLAKARRCIRRGDGWEPENYDRLRRDCDAIGIRGEPAITVALRRCLGEIVAGDLHAREDPGYGGLCAGHDLYEAAWFSARIGREMYLKFSLFDERLIIVSFHESTKT